MSILYIDSKNFNHNIDVISSRVGGVEKIAIVLKDNGYGHGILEMALQFLMNRILFISITSQESSLYLYISPKIQCMIQSLNQITCQ
jgi:alanine racemase